MPFATEPRHLAPPLEGRKGVAQWRAGHLHESDKRLAQLQDEEKRCGARKSRTPTVQRCLIALLRVGFGRQLLNSSKGILSHGGCPERRFFSGLRAVLSPDPRDHGFDRARQKVASIACLRPVSVTDRSDCVDNSEERWLYAVLP